MDCIFSTGLPPHSIPPTLRIARSAAIIPGMNDRPKYCFFLGGADLEMTAIRDLVLEQCGPAALCDAGLSWGAKLSDYGDRPASLPAGTIPVLVELTLDAPVPDRAVIVDHHGAAAGAKAPTSLEQVFALLDLPRQCWTRRLALIAANDRGHVAAMREIGATDAEIATIRTADRAAQGITHHQEIQASQALAHAEHPLNNRLLLLRPPHARTAAITDRLPHPPPPVLIVSPGEINFFGPGPAITALAAAFPHGWYGGNLPDDGFWGCPAPLPAETDILAVLNRTLS